MDTTSYAPLSQEKVTEVINRVRPAIIEYRKLNDERKIQDVMSFLSEKRVFLFFKRKVHVSREDAIKFLRRGSWLDSVYFGRYPSANFKDEEQLCNDLEMSVRAMELAPGVRVLVSVENLAALEKVYTDYVDYVEREQRSRGE